MVVRRVELSRAGRCRLGDFDQGKARQDEDPNCGQCEPKSGQTQHEVAEQPVLDDHDDHADQCAADCTDHDGNDQQHRPTRSGLGVVFDSHQEAAWQMLPGSSSVKDRLDVDRVTGSAGKRLRIASVAPIDRCRDAVNALARGQRRDSLGSAVDQYGKGLEVAVATDGQT